MNFWPTLIVLWAVVVAITATLAVSMGEEAPEFDTWSTETTNRREELTT